MFIEVALVVGRMNNGFAGRNRRSDDAMSGKTRADREYDIGCSQKLVHCRGHDTSAGAERQWMSFRECALSLERRGHRRLQQFGKLDQLIRCLGIEYALSGNDNW